MVKGLYRLDVLGKDGWDTLYLGVSPKRLDEIGYNLLRPCGPFLAYKVRKARKTDLSVLAMGLYKPSSEGLWVWYEWDR